MYWKKGTPNKWPIRGVYFYSFVFYNFSSRPAPSSRSTRNFQAAITREHNVAEVRSTHSWRWWHFEYLKGISTQIARSRLSNQRKTLFWSGFTFIGILELYLISVLKSKKLHIYLRFKSRQIRRAQRLQRKTSVVAFSDRILLKRWVVNSLALSFVERDVKFEVCSLLMSRPVTTSLVLVRNYR